MNKKTVVALIIAIALPLSGYWIMKLYSETAVHMPPHYFYDSIVVKEKEANHIMILFGIK